MLSGEEVHVLGFGATDTGYLLELEKRITETLATIHWQIRCHTPGYEPFAADPISDRKKTFGDMRKIMAEKWAVDRNRVRIIVGGRDMSDETCILYSMASLKATPSLDAVVLRAAPPASTTTTTTAPIN